MAELSSGLATICAIVRNEAAYIREWIAYHRTIGIRNFAIYDNESSDRTVEILLGCQAKGWLRWQPWPTPEIGSPQLSAYADFIQKNQGSDEFVAFIDVDEFLALPAGGTSVNGYFAEHGLNDGSVSAIAINQRVFGSSGKSAMEDGFVIERFTKSALDDYSENKWFKSLVRPSRVCPAMRNSHHVDLRAGRYVDSLGGDLTPDTISGGQTPNIAGGLRLNHYIVKSLGEFRLKQARGGVAGATSAIRAARYSDDFFFGRDEHLNKQIWTFPPPVLEAFRLAHIEVAATE